MMPDPSPLLTYDSAAAFGAWLAAHHADTPVAWLVFRKAATGQRTFGYAEALDEALCWGWIDGIVRRIDGEWYCQRFGPRKDARKWSAANVRHVRRLLAAGRMQPAGLACIAPEVLRLVESGAEPPERPREVPVPSELEAGLARSRAARATWEELPPSCRREYARWVGEAKREETRRRRADEAVTRLAEGKRLGLK